MSRTVHFINKTRHAEDCKGFIREISNEYRKREYVKVYRAMSILEYSRLSSGMTIENNTDWSAVASSNSFGICFFLDDESAWSYAHRDSVIVQMELPKNVLTMTSGCYMDCSSEECCVRVYNNQIARNIKLLGKYTGIRIYK